MQLLMSDDPHPHSLSYWLNGKVFLCAVWVIAPMIASSFIIWKYECSGSLGLNGRRTEQESSCGRYDKSWKPCLKKMHPIFLMVFRMIAFSLLIVALSFDLAIHGPELFFYYTQWTFTLAMIYFGLASLLSAHGCYHHHKNNSSSENNLSEDMERGPYVPLANEGNKNGVKLVGKLDHPGKLHAVLTSSFWDDLLQILYQMTAGAVTLTDVVYWCVIFPFITLRDYEMNFLTVITHSVNGIFLLGDTALNSLPFPWFRFSYFVLWTGVYVLFQWIVHACFTIWWPYPFLDLSAPRASLWYLIVALMHVPCYLLYLLVVKVKHFVLSRWFPNSYQL